MTLDERRKYLHKMQPIYRRARRTQRSALLTEMEQVTGLHRKSLIRLLRGDLRRKKRTRQRGPTYTPQTRTAIRLCAQALDYPCAERLQPVLVSTAQCLARHGHLELTAHVAQQLAQVSVSTVRRIVGPVRQQPARLAASRRPPRQRSAIAQAVPVDIISAHIATPGYLECDTVFHNGGVASGLFVYSLCWTDVYSGWVDIRATLGNSALVMHDAFKALQSRIPFTIHQIHSDNGPEFLNDLIFSFLHSQNVSFSRSRPYRKNDNRFVEENNGSLIRAFVGYARFDSLAQLQALNALYDVLTLYHNLFQPVMRRQEDRSYTVAAPLDRLLSAGIWDEDTAQAWRSYRDALDPLALRVAIADALNALEKAPAAQPDQTEDVRQTLGLWKTGTTIRCAPACPPFPTAPTTATTMPPIPEESASPS
jgi:hypothetical protein